MRWWRRVSTLMQRFAMIVILLTVPAWILSGWIRLSYGTSGSTWVVDDGRVAFIRMPLESGWSMRASRSWQMELGFETVPSPRATFAVSARYVPIWFVTLVAGIVPLVVGCVDRYAARRSNCCSRCGYSLAGLIAGAACPECGR